MNSFEDLYIAASQMRGVEILPCLNCGVQEKAKCVSISLLEGGSFKFDCFCGETNFISNKTQTLFLIDEVYGMLCYIHDYQDRYNNQTFLSNTGTQSLKELIVINGFVPWAKFLNLRKLA